MRVAQLNDSVRLQCREVVGAVFGEVEACDSWVHATEVRVLLWRRLAALAGKSNKVLA